MVKINNYKEVWQYFLVKDGAGSKSKRVFRKHQGRVQKASSSKKKAQVRKAFEDREIRRSKKFTVINVTNCSKLFRNRFITRTKVDASGSQI